MSAIDAINSTQAFNIYLYDLSVNAVYMLYGVSFWVRASYSPVSTTSHQSGVTSQVGGENFLGDTNSAESAHEVPFT